MRTYLKLGIAVLLATGWLLVAFALLGDGPAISRARPLRTSVSGSITTDTIWKVISSPYTVVDNVTVADGVTLTVEPGVTVKFNSGWSLNVQGNIVAVGTMTQPITFTAAVSGANWKTLQIGGGTVLIDSDASRLSYVTLEGGGQTQGDTLYIDRSTPSLDHLTVRRSGGNGISGNYAGPFTLNTALLENNGSDGLYLYQGNGGQVLTNVTAFNNGDNGFFFEYVSTSGGQTIVSATLENNDGHGLFASNGNNVIITHAQIISNSGYGVYGERMGNNFALGNSVISGNSVAARLPASTLLENVSWVNNTRNELEWAGGTIERDTTWGILPDGSNTYRIVPSTNEVTVSDGVTLTVEPGVRVLFLGGKSLNVNGNIVAVGTVTRPITLTAVVPGESGYWESLQIGGGTDLTDSDASHLSYVTIEGGGNIQRNSLIINRSTPRLDHLTVRRSGGSGIYAPYAGPFTLDTALLEDNGLNGLYIYLGDGGQVLTNVTAFNNGDNGIFFTQISNNGGLTIMTATLQNNGQHGLYTNFADNTIITNAQIISNNGYGVYADNMGNNFVLGNSVISGNGVAARLPSNTVVENVSWISNTRNEIEWSGGTINRDTTWGILPDGSNTYRIVPNYYNDVTVSDGVTLTVEPGVQVLFLGGEYLYVNGNIVAVGTPEQPITFTAVVSGASGYWKTLVVGGGTVLTDSDDSRLSYVTIEGGGQNLAHSLAIDRSAPTMDHLTVRRSGGDGIHASQSGPFILDAALLENNNLDGLHLYLGSGGQVLTDVTSVNNGENGMYFEWVSGSTAVKDSCILDNDGHGIYLRLGSLLSMAGSDISGNGGLGVNNTGSATVTATSNWWGHPSGPTHAGNPLGSGQNVSNLVDYSDWAEEPICQSYLRLAKQGPDTVIAGEPMTYTLTVFNRSPVTASNVVITDAVPASISQVQPLDGGSIITGPVVRWTVSEVPAQGSAAVRFVITPTTPSAVPLANSEYRATASDGSTTRGLYPLETTVVRGGSAEFVAGPVLSATYNTGQAGALRDLDGDGDLDAVVVNGSPNQIWLNNGNGTFNPSQSFGDDASQAIALGDLNGDNLPDIVVGNNGANGVWLNQGNGVFNSGSTPDFIFPNSANSQAIALGDLNGDGFDDLFAANNAGNEIWLNNGNGTFVVDPTQTPGSSNSQAIALSDFDADGDLDAVVGNGSGESNELWLNNGSGVFTTSLTATLGSGNAQAIALGDVDQDGHTDVVLGIGDGADQVWLNNGSGVFTLDTTFGAGNSQAIALGDFDGDGDLDAFVGSGGSEGNRVWLNNGHGVFSDTGQPFEFSDSTGIAVGDLDGDGDLDVIVVNADQADRVYLNRNRQVLEAGPEGGELVDVSEGQTITIAIPAGLFEQPTIFTYTHKAGPTPPVSPTLRFAKRAFTLVATQNGLPVSGQLSRALTITVQYSSTGLVHLDDLTLRYRDGVWLDAANTCPPPTTTLRATGVLTVGVCHLTEFALFEPNTAPVFTTTGSPLLTPTNGVTLTTPRPSFAWAKAEDDFGPITYTLTITGGGTFTSVTSLAAVDLVTVTQPGFTPTLDLPAAAYTWTIRAWDEAGLSSAAITPAAFAIAAESGSDVFLPIILKNE